jgi:outer membrane protein OmpA-like peptidoglycan-associated protein
MLRHVLLSAALTLCLNQAARASDCNLLLTQLTDSYASRAADEILGALGSLEKMGACAPEVIENSKRQVSAVMAQLAQQAIQSGDDEQAGALVRKAPALHWAIQAVRGDLAAKNGDRSEAADLYNTAIDTLSDPALTEQNPRLVPVAQKLARLAQENMMLAGTSRSALKRGGEISGVLRGLIVEKIPARADLGRVQKPTIKDDHAASDTYKESAKYTTGKTTSSHAEDKPVAKKYSVTAEAYQNIQSVFLPIRFEFDSDHLNGTGVLEATRLAALLNSRNFAGVRIEGHTDDVGSEAYNLELSVRRAESLRRFLLKEGVKIKISIEGKGENELPEFSNEQAYSLEERRIIRRRVEIGFDW